VPQPQQGRDSDLARLLHPTFAVKVLRATDVLLPCRGRCEFKPQPMAPSSKGLLALPLLHAHFTGNQLALLSSSCCRCLGS